LCTKTEKSSVFLLAILRRNRLNFVPEDFMTSRFHELPSSIQEAQQVLTKATSHSQKHDRRNNHLDLDENFPILLDVLDEAVICSSSR
jgi:hypothetical protein